MIPYTPLDAFTGSDIYDVSDFVIGGNSGTSNVPLKALLDRTNYNNKRLARFEGIKAPSANYSFDFETDNRFAFDFNINANSTFYLPDAAIVPAGYVLPINATITGIKALTVQAYAGQTIHDGTSNVLKMYLHNAERLWLIAAGTYWIVFLADGNFSRVGESFGARKVPRNCITLDGSLFNRADMPRLADFALSLTANEGIVTDGNWLSNPGGNPAYRGCFSTGNTTSTMRLPDERGMFDRYLDLGRGFDNTRIHNYPGGFEDHALQAHVHQYKRTRTDPPPGTPTPYEPNRLKEDNDRGLYEGELVNTTSNTGAGPQTQPKNIGKIPVIRY